MTTITLNPSTKAGKALLELALLLSTKNSGVFINEDVTITKSNAKTPNAKTLKAMHDAENGIELTRTTSHKDLMDKLFS